MRFLSRKLLFYASMVVLLFCVMPCIAKTAPVAITKDLKHILSIREKAQQSAKIGDTENALMYQNMILDKAHKSNLMEQEAIALKDIALLLKDQDAEKSLIHLDNAMNIARSIKHQRLQADIYHAISEVYKLQRNYQAALTALESHTSLIDSLISKERAEDVVTLKLQNLQNMERAIGITVTIAILIISCIIYFYLRKTRSLNKQLKNSIVLKDKLFSILGHDLRGPAGSMMQALQLFGRDIFTEQEEKDMIQSLKKQSKSLYEAIETLFQWSNSQLNGVQIYLQLFDPLPVIYKNIELLAGQAAQKQISIASSFASDGFINADPNHFDYIIRNLLSNAIKFSNKGGSIRVNSENKDDRILFAITDVGIGMSPERQLQFANNSMESTFGTAGEKGIGLGLSLTREFINANNGQLFIKSETNKGTTISFSLPKKPI